MRLLIATIALVLLCCSVASADGGRQADFNSLIDFGDMFGGMDALVPPEAMEAAGAEAQIPDFENMQTSMDMSGKLYWTEAFMRLDYDATEEMHESTIVDVVNGISYNLDHINKTALKMDYSDFDAEMLGLEMPDPEQVASNWNGFLDTIRDTEGAVVNDLAAKQVNGYSCSGYGFSANMMSDPSAMFGDAMPEGDDDMSAMLGAIMSMVGGYSGEIWVTDSVDLPISMSLNSMMMNYTWGISNVEPWTEDMSIFQLPSDYELVELEMPDFDAMFDSMPPAPAPSTT